MPEEKTQKYKTLSKQKEHKTVGFFLYNLANSINLYCFFNYIYKQHRIKKINLQRRRETIFLGVIFRAKKILKLFKLNLKK
jgi:hypothetical protein